MATFVWTLQGTTPTTIDATDILQFAAATFDSAIVVNSYNDSTHVESSVGADDSSANTPKNNKFISQTGGTAGDSQVDVGAGTVDLDAVATAAAVLKINFSHASSVVVSAVTFYAYDGTTPSAVPTGVDFRCAEVGDTNFTEAEGSAAALALSDQTTGTSHDFFIVLSASPTSVGEKTAFKGYIGLTYS